MNKPRLLTALVAVSLLFGGTASAQESSRHNDNRERQGQQRPAREAPQRQPTARPAPRTSHMQARGPATFAAPDPERRFNRGERLPPEYHHRQYVVDDWRGHHLQAPPRGYHWVQRGGDYLLVAIATGVILQVLLNP